MADYIDREAVLNALCDNCDTVQAVCPHFPCKRYTSVEALPSANIQPIVRCKDCTEYQEKFRWCKLHDGEMQSEDFCSNGERKDGEQNG